MNSFPVRANRRNEFQLRHHEAPSNAIRFLAYACTLCALLGMCGLFRVRVNLTASLPIGLYVTARPVLSRGSIVLVCLPTPVASIARERGYLPRGGPCPGNTVPLGKPILAMAGDTVVVTKTGLLLNGIPVPNSAALVADGEGRTLPRLAQGSYPVAHGHLWLVSDYSYRSFDSRYFGPVEASQVVRHVRALWTF